MRFPSLFLIGTAATSIAYAAIYSEEVKKYCENIDSRLPCSVPELHTDYSEGTKFGEFIGKATANEIRSFYTSDDSCPVFQELYDSNKAFQSFITVYMEAHAKQFPVVHEELVAMAIAASIRPEYAFIQNACSELSLMLGDNPVVNNTTNLPVLINIPPVYSEELFAQPISPITEARELQKSRGRREHCSDVGLLFVDPITKETQVIQGHNEDWWSTIAWKMSVVITPELTIYLYPGQLPGTSFVTNAAGLTLSMNSLYPLTPGYHADSVMPNHRGIAYLFSYVLRSIVTLRTTADILVSLAQVPIYAGYSLNVMSACEKSIANLEGYGNRVTITSRHDKRGQVPGSIPHFNAYLNSNVEQDNGQGTSDERLACYQQSQIQSPAEVRSFLGNLSCPVFMTSNNEYGYSETLASWIADPTSHSLAMYRLPVDCEGESGVNAGFQTRCGSSEPQRFAWHYRCETEK